MAGAGNALNVQRSTRQMMEGMLLIFDPVAARDLKATIQFNVSGQDSGTYYLTIESGNCWFHRGQAPKPSLTINTPSDVWQQVSVGQVSGQEALFKGLYTVEGDARLLIRFSEIFKARPNFTFRDASEPSKGRLFEVFKRASKGLVESKPAGRRPAGPLNITGMGWMTIFWVPWTLFWILFDIHSVSLWLSTGIPFILMTLIVLYRIVFNTPIWTETVSWAFFLVSIWLAPMSQAPTFLTWGSVAGSFFVAGLWFISLSPLVKLPFSSEYSKWGFIRALWTNSTFIEINLAISLAWGWQFIIASGFGIAAKMVPSLAVVLTIVRYSLMVPAAIFTSHYQKGAEDRQFRDIDKLMSNQRIWAYIGLGVTLIAVTISWLALRPT